MASFAAAAATVAVGAAVTTGAAAAGGGGGGRKGEAAAAGAETSRPREEAKAGTRAVAGEGEHEKTAATAAAPVMPGSCSNCNGHVSAARLIPQLQQPEPQQQHEASSMMSLNGLHPSPAATHEDQQRQQSEQLFVRGPEAAPPPPPQQHQQQQQQSLLSIYEALAHSPAPLPALPFQELLHQLDLPWKPQKRTVVQGCCLVRPPPVLLLHLQRMGNAKGRLYKIPNHVSFPLVLDMMPYLGLTGELGAVGVKRNSSSSGSCAEDNKGASVDGASSGEGTSSGVSDGANGCTFGGSEGASCGMGNGDAGSKHKGQSQLLYDLKAVGQHIGGYNAGHYLLYRRLVSPRAAQGSGTAVGAAPDGTRGRAVLTECSASQGGLAELGGCGANKGCWVRVSDASVSSASPEEVLQCQATLLVYEQRAAK